MTVSPQNGKIKEFEQTATVGADGVAKFGVRGLDESKSAEYVGKYDVTVECDGGDPLTGSFEVVAAGATIPGLAAGETSRAPVPRHSRSSPPPQRSSCSVWS